MRPKVFFYVHNLANSTERPVTTPGEVTLYSLCLFSIPFEKTTGNDRLQYGLWVNQILFAKGQIDLSFFFPLGEGGSVGLGEADLLGEKFLHYAAFVGLQVFPFAAELVEARIHCSQKTRIFSCSFIDGIEIFSFPCSVIPI